MSIERGFRRCEMNCPRSRTLAPVTKLGHLARGEDRKKKEPEGEEWLMAVLQKTPGSLWGKKEASLNRS